MPDHGELLILVYVLDYYIKEKKRIAMILTCPNCSIQFNLNDDLLGNKGRKVKCSSCGEVWFQEPEQLAEDISEEIPEEIVEEIVEEVEEGGIAEEITPDEEINNIDEVKQKPEKPDNLDKNKAISIGIAASIFFIILIYLLANSANFTKKYPSMHSFYALFGIELNISGQGLVFDQVIASNNGKMIDIIGNIINIEAKNKEVPAIEISLMGANDSLIAKWYINPPVNILEPESSVAFSSSYDIKLDKKQAQHLNAQVRFVLFKKDMPKIDFKTDEASDEGNTAPHQSDSNHQSDHEESSKSHQPAFSAHDQESSHH